MINGSCCRLAEVLSHVNYWFDYLRFCCELSKIADSNQTGSSNGFYY